MVDWSTVGLAALISLMVLLRILRHLKDVYVAEAAKRSEGRGIVAERAELITIPWSHFNELARWCLQYSGADFDERGYGPPFHVPLMGAIRGDDFLHDSSVAAAPNSPPALRAKRRRTATPLFIRSDGEVLPDSWSIAASTGLPAICESLKKVFDEELGPRVRQMTYYYGGLPAEVRAGWAEDGYVGPLHGLATLLYRLVLRRVVYRNICRGLDVTAESAAAAEAACEEIFADVAAVLQRQKFLSGPRVGVADFAFAALVKTIVNPDVSTFEDGPVELREEWRITADLSMARHPGELARIIDKFRAMPAGKHALEIYRRYRKQQAKVGRK